MTATAQTFDARRINITKETYRRVAVSFGVTYAFKNSSSEKYTATFDCKARNEAEALEKFYGHIKKGAMFAAYGLPTIIKVETL